LTVREILKPLNIISQLANHKYPPLMKKFFKLFFLPLFILSQHSSFAAIDSVNVKTKAVSCNGSSDGYITIDSISSTAPSGPYTITITTTPVQTFSVGDTIFNLGQGTYTIRVTDLGDPLQIFPFNRNATVGGPLPLISNIASNPASCFGSCDGQAFVQALQGTAPYTFQWDDPANSTSASIGSLCARTYNVTVTDKNGCATFNSIPVSQNPQILPNASSTQIDCNGANNGTILAAATGGSGAGYIYQWNDPSSSTSPGVNSLPPNSYTVTVTDGSGCTAIQTVAIGEPTAITLTLTPDTIDCFGAATGTAMATVNGGSGPFTYNWPGNLGSNSNTESGFTAGTYPLRVIDSKGCSKDTTFPIEERPELDLGLDSVDVVCNADGNGVVNGTITGGVEPYSWTANDPAGTTGNTAVISVPNLNGGKLIVTVIDFLGCRRLDSIVVNEPLLLVASFLNTTKPPKCINGTDGQIDITFSGGNGGENFSWTGPGVIPNNQNQVNLGRGNYRVTVTDSKGCSVIIDTTLVDPDSILGNLTFAPPQCFGGNDGRVIATPSGGSGVYTNYSFTNPAKNGSDSILTGVSSGRIDVIITDSDGCTSPSFIIVTEPTNPFELDMVADSVNCNGESTGGVTATPSSPLTAGPYTWSWTNAIGTAIGTNDSIITNLPIGRYFVTAVDGNGCQILDSVLIEEPNPINTAIVGTNLNCNADGSGTATATISSGNTPYSWSWSTTPAQTGTGSVAAATNLAADIEYFLTVTDSKGCVKMDSIGLTEPSNFDLFLDSFKLVKCFRENNGAIFVSDSGGTAGAGFPTYVWNDGPITSQDRADLLASATPYKIVATDANGCKDSVIQLITEPTALAVSVIDTDSASCNGANDGRATALATGGTEGNGYLYTWNTVPVQNGATATGLSPNSYIVQVTDSNGCTAPSSAVTIFEPAAIATTMTSDSASCSGFNNGSATVAASSGTPNYTYLWDVNAGSQTTATATNLLANAPSFYVVTVTDKNGCEKKDSVQVGQPNTLSLSIVNQQNVDCAGNLTGAATVDVVGGSLPYTFAWENTGNLGTIIGSNATQSGLAADTFRVTVTDGGGCNDNLQVIITQPDSLKGSITSSISPSCLGSNDGSATVTATGGSLLGGSNYSYSWSTIPLQTTATATGLEADQLYTVTITDDSLCTASVDITLTAPNVFVTADSNVQNVSCFGGNDGFIRLTPTGGTPFIAPANAYNITWTSPSTPFTANGDSIFNLTSGQYIALIEDSRGCAARDTFDLNQPGSGLSLTFDTTDVSCVGADNGTAKVNVIGGTPGYTYDWIGTTFGNVDSIFGLATGTYRVAVTDTNGCVGLDSTIINPAVQISLVVDPNNPVQDVTCAGGQNGSIDVVASGGSGTLGLEWYLLPNRTTQIATNTNSVATLSGGTYRIIVIDGPCSDSIDLVVNEPDTLKAELNKYDISCDGTVLGRAAVNNITGGNIGGQSFVWAPDPGAANGQGTDSIFNLNTGNYSVRVFDAQGCDTTIAFFISATKVTFTFTDSVRNDSCIGAGKGYVGIEGISGGLAPYTYEWSTNPGVRATDPFIDNLTAGTYSVQIRDAAGCDSTYTFRFLSEPIPFTIRFDTTDVSCVGADNGTAKVTVTGGTPGYSYNWIGTTFGDVDSIFGLATGTYRVAVTDLNGCFDLDSTIINPAIPISLVVDPNNPVQDVTCAGAQNGSIDVVSSGGSGTLGLEWYLLPNRTTQIATNTNSVTNLSGGTYRIIVIDGPCSDSLDVVVNEPDTLKAELNAYEINCSGTLLGRAAVRNITGGNTGGQSFVWAPDPGAANGQGTDSVFNLTTGNYSVRVFDLVGCDTTINFTISQTISNFTFADSVRNDSCVGAGKGYVGIQNLSGGVLPYSFEWSTNPGAIVPNAFIDNLTTGNYSVTISDRAGCDSIFTFRTLTEPDTFRVSIIANEDTCLKSLGSASIDPTTLSGGTPPYSFIWPGNISGQAVSNLLGNATYQLTITDANKCQYVKEFTIGNVAPFTITFDTDSVSCKNFTNGAIRVTTVGQASGVTTYTWTPSIQGGATPSGLSAGTYSLNVTDANGCVATGSVDVGEPDVLVIDSVNTIAETCVPGSDGSAVAFSTGGNPPYRYNWADGNGFTSSNTISNLTSGNYRVTIQDRKFCSDVFNFTIGNTAPFQIDSTTVVDASCPGEKDGSILVHLSGTIPVVTYTWGIPTLTGANPSGLGRGSYALTVTDGTNCSVNTVITVRQVSNLISIISRKEDETCSPGADGWAVVGATNGVEPYTYQWDPKVTFGSTADSAFNLIADGYEVTVTDGNLCTSKSLVTIDPGANIDYTILAQSGPLCFGDNNVSITIEGTGGLAPYSYTWFDGSTGPSKNGLRSGIFAVTITDSANPPCVKTENITIAPASPISLTVTTSIETCSPGVDGSATVGVDGGAIPFTYVYSGSGTVGTNPNEYENLVAGSYTVNVTDGNGCPASSAFSITSASSFPFNTSLTKKDPTCANGTDGEFSVQVTGGSNPFTYSWTGGNGNAAAADPDNLVAGIYTLTVSDFYGCEIIKTDTLFDKAPIIATFAKTKDDCAPANTGSATATAANGLSPYTYRWPTATISGSVVSGASGETFSNLPSGTYTVTVSDATVCSAILPFTIEKSAPFTLTTAKDNVSCNGLTDGSITLSVTGVTTPNTETYSWSINVGAANINNQSQTNLTAGTYLVTVTDPANSCEETETFIVEEPDTIAATAALINVSCNGGGSDGAITLTVLGGTAPYTYNWGGGVNSKNRSGLVIGDYTVSISDARNCGPFTATYSITNQPQFTVSLDSTDLSCPGARDGFITATTTATNPTYLWSDGNSGRLRGGLFAGKYIVTVTDGNTGCQVVDSTFINEEDSIKMFFSVSDENCSPGMDGIAKVDSTKGGTPGYSYSFSAGTPFGSDAVNQLSAGMVQVTATDFKGCTAIDSFEVKKAAPFDANFIFTDAICQGDSSGTASIITTNSSGSLSFSWPLGSVLDPSDSTQNKLIAGTYIVNIFDPANGCDEDLTIVINEPDTIKPRAIIIDENCNPGGDGSISLAPNGGDGGPYAFNWSGTGVIPADQNQSNLSAGTYFVTITDGIGCAIEDSIAVEFIISTVPNLTTTDDGCQLTGLCTGSAKANPTNGVLPYTFEWKSSTGVIPVSPTTDSIGALCAGDYTLKIIDGSGCDTLILFTIGGNRTILPNAIVTDESCGATDNGSISVTPSGGDAPYTYTWSNSTAIDSNRTNLAPGNYGVTVTDATGCIGMLNTVVGTDNFDYTISSTDLSCSGGNDGTADITIVGGTAGFTFIWTPTPANGQNTPNVSNLSVGTYSVLITNTTNNCSTTETVDIRPTSPIAPNELVSDESCFGQNDGSIVLSVVGGAGNYTYNWSANVPAGTIGNSAIGLTSGNYTVQITDAAGCDTTISVVINAASDIIASITENNATCTNSGVCDGSAVLTVTSVGTFSYVWSPGITVVGNDSAAINLCPGTYFVDITNSIGCSKRVPFTIGGPNLIDPNITSTSATCNISNGVLTAAPTGGTGALTVEWLDNSFVSIGTGTTVNSLAAGAYFAVVLDATGCRDTFPTNLNDIGAEAISISASNDVSCFGGSDGGATVDFVCNDPSCATEWFAAGGASVGFGRTITGLTAGDYYVEVRNNSNCLAVEPITIAQPTPFSISETIVSNDCSGGINGTITLSVSGGAGNFSYLWSPSPASGQGTNSISGLAVGTYTVNITDGNSCDSTLSFDILEPTVIVATFSTTSSNCNQSDGQIVATVAGGTVAFPITYDYQWFDANNLILVGETTDTLKNIAAGTYRLRVRDDNACQQVFSVNVSDLNGPTVVIDSVLNVGCFGESNGGVFISPSGNNPPFTFNWLPNGNVSEDITNLTAGVYSVQVTDASGCITNAEDTVREATELMAVITAADATCGVCNGTASVSITGGSAPYTYLWSNGETADNADSLCGGNYSLVLTDASGCNKSFDFGVNTIGGPTGETVLVSPASCANSNDGSATVTPIGGTPPYSYLWQHNGITTNSLSNLAAGTYFLQISDVRSCSRTVQIDILSPTPVVLNQQVVSSTCNQSDGSILLNVTGGQSPYRYNWFTATTADTNFINNRAAGLYPISVTDANGCIVSTTIAINNSGSTFTPNPTGTDISCFGQCDGSLISNITGVPVDFRWLDAQRNSLAPLNADLTNTVCAGVYFLEITTNPLGCRSYVPVTITEPDSITLSSNIIKDISCNGACDGQVFINTVGGNILYTYSWSDPNNQNQIPANGLCAGTYTVTATDANGCSATTSVTFTDPPVLTGSITTNTNLICSSDCDATATSVANGGNPPYTFAWSGGQSVANPTDLCFGMNVLTVTDARNCSVTDTILVSAIDTVIAESFGQPLICDGEFVTLSGVITGTSITSFGWYLADTTTLLSKTLDTSFVRPVGSYTYFLIATSGSCSDTAKFEVKVAANPLVNLESDIRRFGDEVTVIALGNDDPSYSYLWTPGKGLDDSTKAEPTTQTEVDITYTLLVTDTNGCKYSDSVFVSFSPNIEVPSGFTPNNDGANDVWNIRLLEKFPNASVQIYNRWGQLLFEQQNGYTIPWNGKYKGKELPIGTYYYIIDLKDPKVKPLTGPITIIK